MTGRGAYAGQLKTDDSFMHQRYRPPVRATGIVSATLAMAGLCGCALGPNFHAPAPPDTDHYVAGDQVLIADQTLVGDQEIPERWWSLFHSAPLDVLVRTALQDSPTIAAAQAALRSAQQGYVAQRGASLYPQVDGQFQAQREAASGAAFGFPQAGSSTFTLFDAAVNVSYKFDLVGGTRRQLEALAAQSDYQRWQLEAARLTLAANVVTTVISAAALNDEVAATQDILASQRHQLAIIQRQQAVGAASQADVLTQQANLAVLEATLPGLQKSLAQADHRLAVLTGRTPDHARDRRPVAELPDTARAAALVAARQTGAPAARCAGLRGVAA